MSGQELTTCYKCGKKFTGEGHLISMGKKQVKVCKSCFLESEEFKVANPWAYAIVVWVLLFVLYICFVYFFSFLKGSK